MKTTRFELATRFTGMIISMFSSIALLAAGVISESVWQYVMLGSYLVYSGADVADYGIASVAKRGQS